MTEQDKQGAFGGEAESGRVSDAQHTSQPTAKMTRKNKWIIVGVVAAVLVVAGAGFWVWHEQPSFCNAICHSPMDKYVETYYEGDPGKLVTAHAEAGDACLDCHEAEITTPACHGQGIRHRRVLHERRLPQHDRRREFHMGLRRKRREVQPPF